MGLLDYLKILRSRLIRTRHGQEAIVLEASYKLSLYDYQLNERKDRVYTGDYIIHQ